MEFISSGISDAGNVRESNQDSFGIFESDMARLFVVADGMGGYKDGEKASRAVVDLMAGWWDGFCPDAYARDFERMLAAIEQVLGEANRVIFEGYNQDGICGTTVVILFIYQNRYGVIYAGDSRCYCLAGRRFRCLTIDEVWENQSGISGRECAIANHPDRGKLVNAVGIRESVQCRALTGGLRGGETFLLCSDGLYKYCNERQIRRCMRRCANLAAMEGQLARLRGVVGENGAGDNVTVIAVRCRKQRNPRARGCARYHDV